MAKVLERFLSEKELLEQFGGRLALLETEGFGSGQRLVDLADSKSRVEWIKCAAATLSCSDVSGTVYVIRIGSAPGLRWHSSTTCEREPAQLSMALGRLDQDNSIHGPRVSTTVTRRMNVAKAPTPCPAGCPAAVGRP